MATGATIYGVNTGFGKLANQRIEADEVLALQENLLRSHAVGMGPLLSIGVSRLALALRIQALAKGYSGVTSALIDTLIEMYNRGVVPAIPEQGSVGASGDLAPLAHLALVVMGEGHAFVTKAELRKATSDPRRKPAAPARLLSGRAALRRVHLNRYRPLAKEGLSLINGTQISTAILADALVRARHLAKMADVAGAMTVEATKSSLRPFDPRIQAVRPHPGQMACAANLRRLLEESEIMASHADCSKVQDAYSIRCMPQVHGTLRDAIAHVTGVVECEMNAATDNPARLRRHRRDPVRRQLSRPADRSCRPTIIAAAVADLSSISERRVENLVNPDLSGLPGFLTPHPGLNSGMMLVQVLAAALVSENKAAAFPGERRFDPDLRQPRGPRVHEHDGGAEMPHRSWSTPRGFWLASCCVRPRDWSSLSRSGRAEVRRRLIDHIREHVRPLGRDRTLHRDLEAVERLIRSGSLLATVEQECEVLE